MDAGQMDAGQMRETLSRNVYDSKERGDFSCWSEAFDLYRKEIMALAKASNNSVGFITACTIDDVEMMTD